MFSSNAADRLFISHSKAKKRARFELYLTRSVGHVVDHGVNTSSANLVVLALRQTSEYLLFLDKSQCYFKGHVS